MFLSCVQILSQLFFKKSAFSQFFTIFVLFLTKKTTHIITMGVAATII